MGARPDQGSRHSRKLIQRESDPPARCVTQVSAQSASQGRATIKQATKGLMSQKRIGLCVAVAATPRRRWHREDASIWMAAMWRQRLRFDSSSPSEAAACHQVSTHAQDWLRPLDTLAVDDWCVRKRTLGARVAATGRSTTASVGGVQLGKVGWGSYTLFAWPISLAPSALRSRP